MYMCPQMLECWVNSKCIYANHSLVGMMNIKTIHLDLYRQRMNGHLKMNTKHGNDIHIFENTVRLHAWKTKLGLFPARYTHMRTYLNPETNRGHCGKWNQDCTGYIKKKPYALLTNTSRQREREIEEREEKERDGDKGIPKMTMWPNSGNMKTWLELLISDGENQMSCSHWMMIKCMHNIEYRDLISIISTLISKGFKFKYMFIQKSPPSWGNSKSFNSLCKNIMDPRVRKLF